MRWSCGDVDTESRTHAFFDWPNLFGGKRTEAVHQPHRGYGNNALCPRREAASSPLSLTTIKLLENLISRAHEFVIRREGIRQIARATKELRQDLTLVGLGQRLKGL